MITKREKDKKIVERFNYLIATGISKTEATDIIMREFNILTAATVWRIRKKLGA